MRDQLFRNDFFCWWIVCFDAHLELEINWHHCRRHPLRFANALEKNVWELVERISLPPRKSLWFYATCIRKNLPLRWSVSTLVPLSIAPTSRDGLTSQPDLVPNRMIDRLKTHFQLSAESFGGFRRSPAWVQIILNHICNYWFGFGFLELNFSLPTDNEHDGCSINVVN